MTSGSETETTPAPQGAGVDVYLAGLGLRPSHITPETSRALARCRRIHHISYVPGTDELLRQYCDDVVDLRSLYESGSDRLETYKAQATAVLDSAIEQGPVGLVVYGHPLILAMPSMFVLRLGSSLGLRVRTLPAVSALDCLLADLGIDPTVTGMQMHEATDLLLYQRPIVPGCATVLWQVGSLATRLHVTVGHSRPERLMPLRDYLLRFYPPDHEAVSVSTAVTEDEPPELLALRIGELPEHSARLHLGATLYIPPVKSAGPVDEALAAKLTSTDHLRSIVETTG
ncbi:SAM-dependent methyltransferase [Actinoplanes sp. NPDC024001]|uniref:SAM-dependent methyltransferase n=1 Tax=Actinoplanes sp. NPDC024001 TaxID=3154598 RepID=UPI00340E1DBE